MLLESLFAELKKVGAKPPFQVYWNFDGVFIAELGKRVELDSIKDANDLVRKVNEGWVEFWESRTNLRKALGELVTMSPGHLEDVRWERMKVVRDLINLELAESKVSEPLPFRSYLGKDGQMYACIGVSQPVQFVGLGPNRIHLARFTCADDTWVDVGIFEGMNHADCVWSGQLVILQRGGKMIARPLEAFKREFVLKE